MKFNIGKRVLEFNEDTKELIFKNKIFTPGIRTFGNMKELYSSKNKLSEDTGLYYMYRDVSFNKVEENIMKKNKIRFDITIIPGLNFNGEPSKTFGHYHPKNSNGRQFQELYQVLSGEAIYLQQNTEKVFFTNAKKSEAVNMEEGFGHITINPNLDTLIMVNLVDDSFSSVYDDYKTKKGGMYYFKNGEWITNKNFEIKHPEIKEKFDKFEVMDNIYDDFLITPEKFNYLH